MPDPNSGFRIGPEEGTYGRRVAPSSRATGGTDRRRVERLGRRITWLAILLPLLAILVTAFAYFDLRGRMGGGPKNDFATAAQVAELNDRIAALDRAIEDKEGPLNEAFLVFERTNASLQEELGKLGIRIDQLKTGKAEIADLEAARKSLADRVTALSEQVSPMQENLTAVRESMDTLRNSVAGLEERVTTQVAEKTAALTETQNDLVAQVESVTTTATQLRAELDQVAEQVIEALKVVENAARGRGSVDAALAARKRETDETVRTLNREINANDARTRSLRRDLDALQRQVETLARRAQRPLGTPERGTVLEQDLQ